MTDGLTDSCLVNLMALNDTHLHYITYTEVWSVFCCRCLVEVTKLNLGQYYEAMFGQDFKFKFIPYFKINA